MSDKETYKAERRAKTREAAEAFLDDLEFFRATLGNKQISSGDLRRMSAQLRRILVDETLIKIAAPRVGKIKLLTTRNQPIIDMCSKAKPSFVGLGPVNIFGIEATFVTVTAGDGRSMGMTPDWHPEQTVLVSPESFLKQGVIYFRQGWILRSEVIKYIANIAHGVHSGDRENERETMIRRARHVATLSMTSDGFPSLNCNLSAFDDQVLPPLIDRTKVDWFLVELWTAASYLLKSPDVQNLEDYIRSE